MNLFLKVLLAPLIPVAVIVGIVILVGIVAGIVSAIFGKGKDPAKKAFEEEERQIQQEIKEKYKDAAVLKKYRGGTLRLNLLRLGEEALKEGEPEKAREYLEDSLALEDSSDAKLLLAASCVRTGEREKALEIAADILQHSRQAEEHFMAVAYRLTDRPLETLTKGKALAREYGNARGDLYRAASAQLAQAALESYDVTVREARERAEAGDPAGAADFYGALYYAVNDTAEKEGRSKYQKTLTELATQTAICCCEAGRYDDAKIYTSWQMNTFDHSLYQCVRMLAVTHGGTRTIKSEFDFLDLENGIPVAERAVREGIPGAEQVRKMLKEARDEALASEAAEASAYLAEVAFEEAHGMSREEYKERQKEAAEEQARAERADRLRKKIEMAERDADLFSGGSGYSMEEKLARGELSYSDHEIYAEAKEKYIQKKTR